MMHRFPVLVLPALALALNAQTPSTAANQSGKAKTWTAPRGAGGHPDLEGFWTNAALTPFERPAEFAGKEFFTEEEATAFEERALAAANRDRRAATAEADVGL